MNTLPEGTVAMHGNEITVIFETREEAERAFDIIEASLSPQAAPAGAVEALSAAQRALEIIVPSGETGRKVKADALKAIAAALAAPPSSGQRVEAPLAANPAQGVTEASFQNRVQPWMMACFGPEISSDRVERGDRFLEEAFELLQSGGYDPARALALRDYVWGRDKGEPAQEVGGVMVTLAAYCLAHELDMHAAGETELARIWTKVEKIRAKQAAKPVGSALPVAALTAAIGAGGQAVEAPAVKALEWREDRDDDGTETHRTRGGSVNLPYTVYEDGFTAKPFGLSLNQLRIGSFNTAAEAKAAAQADYEARIRSALAPAPSQPGTQPGQTEKLGKSVSEEGNNVSGTAEQIVAEPVAWQYRWKLDGEWTDWRVSDHSQKTSGLKDLEERPLYATPSESDRLTKERDEARAQRDYWRGRDKAGCEIEAELTARAEALSAALDELRDNIEELARVEERTTGYDDDIRRSVGLNTVGQQFAAKLRSLLDGEKGRG